MKWLEGIRQWLRAVRRLWQWPEALIEKEQECLNLRGHLRTMNVNKEALLRDLEQLKQDHELARVAADGWRERCADLRGQLDVALETALTPGETGRLALLAEQCAGAVRAAAWVMKGGFNGPAPFGTLTNRVALERELGAVRATINLLHDAGDVRGKDLAEWQRKFRVTVLRETVHQEVGE